MLLLKLASFLLLLDLASGYFKWNTCGVKEKRSGFTLTKNSNLVISAHGCEDKAAVTLACKDGYKIAVLDAFFGHGHGHKSTCDSSWFGQNCGARGAVAKVKYLCQNKKKCVINPTTAVLGSTSCTFGLDSDLHIKYKCNEEYVSNAVLLNSLDISPSPLTLPGALNLSASLSINRYLPASTKLKLKIQKKAPFWVTIPCVANYGSCTYDNFCQMVREMMFNKCDKEMEARGVPCDCPFPTGTFNIPTQTVTVTEQQISEIPIPDFIVNGKYYLKAEFLDVYDRPLGCFEVYLQVHVSDKKKRVFDLNDIGFE